MGAAFRLVPQLTFLKEAFLKVRVDHGTPLTSWTDQHRGEHLLTLLVGWFCCYCRTHSEPHEEFKRSPLEFLLGGGSHLQHSLLYTPSSNTAGLGLEGTA